MPFLLQQGDSSGRAWSILLFDVYFRKESPIPVLNHLLKHMCFNLKQVGQSRFIADVKEAGEGCDCSYEEIHYKRINKASRRLSELSF